MNSYPVVVIFCLFVIVGLISYLLFKKEINRFFSNSWVYDNFLMTRWGFKFIPTQDKLIHFLECHIAVKVITPMTGWFVAFAIVQGLMILYELTQSQFSVKDVIANMLGGLWAWV